MHRGSSILIKNRRATFDYELLERFTAGIQLVGTEIKAIREGKAGLSDAYAIILHNEVWIKNMHIAEYAYGNIANHEVRRDRKLLLTKREIFKLIRATKETGFTIIPVKLFINDRGLAKLEIAVARGKKKYDKRQSLREKEDRRQMDRLLKH
ncbi:MAG: SsrA-binding protein SmpB [Microbacter sp.]